MSDNDDSCQVRPHPPQHHQALVDVAALLEPDPHGSSLCRPLAARQVHQVKL